MGGTRIYAWGTIAGNVPLNNRLSGLPPNGVGTADIWRHYLVAWTICKHVRTVSALVAAVLFVAAFAAA